jgi:prepilin-type N-terminal cleavage/methylation domain-containing protein
MKTMTVRRLKSKTAFTILEMMIAIVILAVAVIGASGYRYYAAIDARRGAMKVTAARIGLLLCENWRGVKGDTTYDPATYFASELTISAQPGFDDTGFKDADFALLGSYLVVADSADYYAILSWKDVGAGLRALNIVLAWPPSGQAQVSAGDTSRRFLLTTYTPI